MKLALLLALLGAASGTIMFPRNGCGCGRNINARPLTPPEIKHLRGYVYNRGVKHADVLTDACLQGVFKFSILNNFPDVVPVRRAGMIQIIEQGLSELTDKVVPGADVVAKIVRYLGGAVPELKGSQLNVDLSSLVPACAVVLHQRGVQLTHQQLQVFLRSALSGYLQSPAYKADYSPQSQLVACLDHFDHQLPSILELAALLPVRRQLEKRFNLESDIFDHRFRQAVKAFEANRRRILESFNTIAFRGSRYEITIQQVIAKVVKIFPGTSQRTIRAVLNILQLTNTKGGQASPRDLLAMIAFPAVDKSLRDISVEIAHRWRLYFPKHIDMSYAQVREAYALYIIGLLSQGVQPAKLSIVHRLFVEHTQRFFLGVPQYNVESYILYVVRVVVPSIPRGSPGFIIRLFENTVVIDNVLVPEPLKSIYQEGRDTIIPRIFGLQGNSIQISRRLARGEGAKPDVENIVNLRPRIVSGPLPTEDFSYSGVLISAAQLRAVSAVLEARFAALKSRRLYAPIIKVLIDADIIGGSGEKAAASLRRLFDRLPDFDVPSGLDVLVTQLSRKRLQLTRPQLLAGLQQFYVCSRALGHVIPRKALPGVFAAALGRYVQTLPKIPAQPFDIGFLRYLQKRLVSIIQRVVLVGDSVPVLGPQLDKIFSVFPGLAVSPNAQRAIVRFIESSNLIKGPIKDSGSAAEVLHRLLSGISNHYPHDAYILRGSQLKLLLTELRRRSLKISIQDLRDANAMALCGLGLFKRLETGLKPAQLRVLIRRAILSFVRVNKVSNIATEDFFRALFGTVKVPLPELPVPQAPVYQQPKPYVPPPIMLVPGLSLTVKKVEYMVSLLRRRFSFVSLDNVQPILAHIISILRSRGEKITQAYLEEALVVYITALPKFPVKGVDLAALLKRIDEQLVDVTITGIGIQSAFCELYLSLHALKLPLPSAAVRDDFFTLVVTMYGRTFIRQQIRFGVPFYEFLGKRLPKLVDYVKPFPLFAAPKLFFAFQRELKPAPVPVADIRILIQVVIRGAGLKPDGLTLARLLAVLRDREIKKTAAAGPLSDAELKAILAHVQQKRAKVTQAHVRRAFIACRLALRLTGAPLSRKVLVQTFSRVVVTVVQRYQKLLVPQLASQLVSALQVGGFGGKLGGDFGSIVIEKEPKKHFGGFFRDD
nr:CP100k-like protein 1 [Chthamalus malayensis]